MDDRRQFLKRIARGAVYAAPVVTTLATPSRLPAIVTTGMMIVLPNSEQEPPGGVRRTPSSEAPWNRDAPWTVPPSGSGGGSGSGGE